MATDVLDSHTHILPDEFRRDLDDVVRRDRTFAALFGGGRGRTAGVADLIASMDSAGLAASVAAGYGWTDMEVARQANDYALHSSARHPGRVIPFCSVPLSDPQSAAAEVERCAKAGARGVGELHLDAQLPGVDAAGLNALGPVMAVARQFGLPLLVHVSEPVGHAYPGKGEFTPAEALRLAQMFPSNQLIFAHFGGGLLFHALMPEVRSALSNVWFDSAAQPFLYRPEVYEASVMSAGSDRVLFGSDFPLLPQRRALAAAGRSGLPATALGAVLGGNARALLGRSVIPRPV